MPGHVCKADNRTSCIIVIIIIIIICEYIYQHVLTCEMTRVVSLEIAGGKFAEIYSNLSGNLLRIP